jgi:hypothetical protein
MELDLWAPHTSETQILWHYNTSALTFYI